MLDRMKYINHLGEVINFGDGQYLFNERDVRAYEWDYDGDLRISNFHRKIHTKDIEVLVIGKQARQAANLLHEILDKDVREEKPGYILLNGYRLPGYFIASEVSDNVRKTAIKLTLTYVSDAKYWYREIERQFSKHVEEGNIEGLDYPYDYLYDYVSRNNENNTLDNPSAFLSDFRLTIYGACVNPSILINGHRYAIIGDLAEGEYCVIDSAKKTITKYGLTDTENWFHKRYKPESIFEKIPGNISSVSWEGNFAFNVAIIDQRSEPPWEPIEWVDPIPPSPDEETPEPPDEPEEPDEDEEEGYILADGNAYVLADGSYYEVAG